MKFPKGLKGAMQGALVNQAYNTYCFGFKQAKENKELLNKSDFCRRIKEANEEGAKLGNKETLLKRFVPRGAIAPQEAHNG